MVLPNPPQSGLDAECMVKTAIPAVGYAILEREIEPKKVEAKKEGTLSWVGFLTACILLLLFFSGSFGYHPQ